MATKWNEATITFQLVCEKNKEIKQCQIGIGKNKYNRCILENLEVYRGKKSQKTLYVTSKGMDNEKAKELVKQMAGENRLPYFVQFADNRARDWNC